MVHVVTFNTKVYLNYLVSNFADEDTDRYILLVMRSYCIRPVWCKRCYVLRNLPRGAMLLLTLIDTRACVFFIRRGLPRELQSIKASAGLVAHKQKGRFKLVSRINSTFRPPKIFILIRSGADTSLAFPISYFPTCSLTKRICLRWTKEIRTAKS
jgi:hypothetical protein